MGLNWLDQLGNWNPQLLRELKGRCKTRNLLAAGAISLLGQLLLFLYFDNFLPTNTADPVSSRYCTGGKVAYAADSVSGSRYCFKTNGDFIINWQSFWLDLFTHLSMIGIFVLLVVGTYLVIVDLAQEERRGTLNFIRLSPQPTQHILLGKLLGVPVLLYFVAILAVPLHLWAGFSAQIPPGLILGSYFVLIASCTFFYSAALLYSLVTAWLGGFQAFLGSGAVLIFLGIVSPMLMRMLWGINLGPMVWLNLFSPAMAIPFLKQSSSSIFNSLFGLSGVELTELHWFYLPLGASPVVVIGFLLLNYGLWTYWSWQALERCFRNSNMTWLSKRQSYLLVACFEVIILGFALQEPSGESELKFWLFKNFSELLILNLGLFLGLIAALSPQRQTLQDWARYRRERVSGSQGLRHRYLIQDLIWGEKSPALVVLALNLAITAALITVWVLLWPPGTPKLQSLGQLILSCNMILIYAAIAQLLLLMQNQKHVLWAIATIGGAILLPPIYYLLTDGSSSIPGLWIFSVLAIIFEPQSVSATKIGWGVWGQWGILGLLSISLSLQLKRAGASSSKALLSQHRVLPTGSQR